jgi:hypothetical protein
MAEDKDVTRFLLEMQKEITGGIAGVSLQVVEVKNELADVKAEQASQKRELGDLRQVVEDRTGGIGLTKTQKAALWAGVSGLALEGLRHVKSLLFGLLMFVKSGGVRQ